jgi:serine/threonine protein kinase
MRDLVRAGASVGQNGAGETPLHVAVKTGNVAAVRLLVAARELDVNAVVAGSDWSALHVAIARDSLECVQLLLGVGASLWLRGYTDDHCDYCIPLHLALRNRDRGTENAIAIINELIEAHLSDRQHCDIAANGAYDPTILSTIAANRAVSKVGAGAVLAWRSPDDRSSYSASAELPALPEKVNLTHVDMSGRGPATVPLYVRCCAAVSPIAFTQLGVDPLDVYSITGELGRGAFGVVHDSKHRTTGRRAALKTIEVQNMTARQLERTLREIEIMREAKHPNIVSFHGNYYYKGVIWIAMEVVTGGNVSELLSQVRKAQRAAKVPEVRGISENQARWVMQGLLRALAHLHMKRITHRDVKPANVLLTAPEGTVKLADFGVSQVNQSRLKTLIGTPYFLAPEMIQTNAEYSYLVDSWAAGVTLYHVVNGKPPYHGVEPMKALMLIYRSAAPKFNPAVFSRDLCQFGSSLLCKDAEERAYPSAALDAPFFTKHQRQLTPGNYDVFTDTVRPATGTESESSDEFLTGDSVTLMAGMNTVAGMRSPAPAGGKKSSDPPIVRYICDSLGGRLYPSVTDALVSEYKANGTCECPDHAARPTR